MSKIFSFSTSHCVAWDFKISFNKLKDPISRFACTVIQSLVRLFQGRFEAAIWNFKNIGHFKALTPFFFNPLPVFSNQQFTEPFDELWKAYQALEGLSPDQARKKLNKELSFGFCHAECLTLVELMREYKCSLSEALLKLKEKDHSLLLFEICEIFRNLFQRNQREDLMQKLQDFNLKGLQEEKEYEIGKMQASVMDQLKSDLARGDSLVVVRTYNDKTGHTFILEINSSQNSYSFYNSAHSGCYAYDHVDEFAKAFIEHVESHTPYLKNETGAFWELSFYSRN